MGQDHGEENAPLHEGLDRLPAGSFDLPLPPAGLREEVYRRTTRAVRARVRNRRLRLALAFAIIFGAGLLTGRHFHGRPPAGTSPRGPEAPARSFTAPSTEPGEIQRRVPDAVPEDRPALLRQAGDSYLLTQGDLERALDCYRQYLEIDRPEGRKSSPAGDTWLLEALKQGRNSNPRR